MRTPVRFARPVVLAITLVTLAPVGSATAEPPRPASTPDLAAPSSAQAADGRHDFDFFVGRWRVVNRRLAARLAGSTTWQTFEAISDCRLLLDGLANEDVFTTDFWPGFRGMSFRFFDPATRTWSIYWADNRTGVLQPPVVGSFHGDEGVFTGPDVFAGRPIVVRYLWTRVGTPSPRWEQAFSTDGGTTWETNWTMDFTRFDAEPTPAEGGR